MNEPKERGFSPWGPIQFVTPIFEGCWGVCTASHGGIKLSRSLNAKVPEYARSKGGWYEEDCDWAIPACVFAEQWKASQNNKKPGEGDSDIEQAKKSLRDWNPDIYAKLYNVPLESLRGHSYIYDQRVWKEEHKNDWQTLAAWGSHDKNVPDGMVGVVACVGGRLGNGRYAGQERYFLVPEDEYQNRQGTYIVDPETAQHWDGPGI